MNNIKLLQKASKLSVVAFSSTYHIPIRTLEDWLAQRRNCPSYVFELLEYRVLDDLLANELANDYANSLSPEDKERVELIIKEKKKEPIKQCH